FALYVDRDLFRQIAVRDRGRYLCNIAHLPSQVAGHEIHAVSQVFPGPGYTVHLCLTPQISFRAYFAGHARYLSRERTELVHHGVDGVLQLQDFATHIDGDLFREVTGSDRCRHIGNIAHLPSQIAGHRIHAVSQIFPGPRNAGHLSLAAQNSFGTHFAGDASYFRSERTELVHHGVDCVLELRDFAFHVDRDLFGEIAIGD